MAGPTKPYDEHQVGKQLQTNYAFLEKLFGPKQKAFRDRFFRCKSEAALRRALRREGVRVAAGVKTMIVDVENARVKSFGINPRRDNFYILVMAPVPRRKKSEDYRDSQAWEGAWYHAIVDGYGM